MRTPDGALGVLVADVSGHGVPAAIIASMVKIAFASEADHARDPAALFADCCPTSMRGRRRRAWNGPTM